MQTVFNCKLLGDTSQYSLLALKLDYTPLSEFDGEVGRDGSSKNMLIKGNNSGRANREGMLHVERDTV